LTFQRSVLELLFSQRCRWKTYGRLDEAGFSDATVQNVADENTVMFRTTEMTVERSRLWRIN
jgi:hypothetical protein